MSLSRQTIDEFLSEHSLPNSFRQLIDDHYLPLVEWIIQRQREERPLAIGINGAQGTGKSTLADFLKLGLELQHEWRVAVLSIDDFYLTKAERDELAAKVHPLLATRGAPGTHDVDMLATCVARLKGLCDGEQLRLPRFDKAVDDRANESTWPIVDGPLDLVILEGWCVGSVAQPEAELVQPVNKLERDEDPSATWRFYVNERLSDDYMPIFSQLDALILLKAPDFDAVYRWRLEQERKLADVASTDASGIMDANQIARFIQFYERIARTNQLLLSESADVVLELDENHACTYSHYKSMSKSR